MTDRQYIVTVEAKVRATIAIEAPDKATATRRALENGPDSGELAGTPQRITARVCSVREVGSWQSID